MKKPLRAFSIALLLGVAACTSAAVNSTRALAATDGASDALAPHVFQAGETFIYDYDNTDTAYCADIVGHIAIAKVPQATQQIKIPVRIDILKSEDSISHKLTALSEASYRNGDAAALTDVPFRRLSELIDKFPAELTYTYPDEKSGLSHLFDLFGAAVQDANFIVAPLKQILFFKMQDIHQMQASAIGLKDGLLPGNSYVIPSHKTTGLGGKFIGGTAQYLYVGTENVGGVRAALIRVNDLGNRFSTANQKAVTNFTFSMYVALEGPAKGLLISGSGQETAFPVQHKPDHQCAQPILQRQFSIHLR
jgi:hypothetical protein